MRVFEGLDGFSMVFVILIEEIVISLKLEQY